eukprot:COSAG01_NODE_778_length_13681_cov_15.265130_16_plen_140_part_00
MLKHRVVAMASLPLWYVVCEGCPDVRTFLTARTFLVRLGYCARSHSSSLDANGEFSYTQNHGATARWTLDARVAAAVRGRRIASQLLRWWLRVAAAGWLAAGWLAGLGSGVCPRNRGGRARRPPGATTRASLRGSTAVR